MIDNIDRMHGKYAAEKIGYAVSIGVYFVFFSLFATISLPFYLLGLVVGTLVDRKR